VPKCIDATDEAQAHQTVADTAAEFARIDILVNVVGGSTIIEKPNVDIDQMPLDDWEKILDFNLKATFLFTHTVVPIKKGKNHGKIANLAPITGRGAGFVSSSAYAGAKSGIVAMIRRLSFELGSHGLYINAIAPTSTPTERITPHWQARSEESRAAELKRFPLSRAAVTEDQAKVIAFLASADADFVTGVTIDVNAGRL